MAKEDKKTVYRRSDTGQWTSKEYAESHQRTTEKERVRVVPPSPRKDK